MSARQTFSSAITLTYDSHSAPPSYVQSLGGLSRFLPNGSARLFSTSYLLSALYTNPSGDRAPKVGRGYRGENLPSPFHSRRPRLAVLSRVLRNMGRDPLFSPLPACCRAASAAPPWKSKKGEGNRKLERRNRGVFFNSGRIFLWSINFSLAGQGFEAFSLQTGVCT